MNKPKIACLTFTAIFLGLAWFLSGCSMHMQGTEGASWEPTKVKHNTHRGQKTSYITLESGDCPLSPVAADFNGDGYKDIAVVSHGKSQLKIFWGGPHRTFKAGPVYGKEQVGYHPGKITVTDWNGDGRPDILLACEGIFQVQYWENTGNGFIKKASFKVWLNAKSIKCGDIDGDGRKDIVLGGHQGNSVLVLWGRNGFFKFTGQKISALPLTENVELGDWNGDGRTDIFWVEKRNGSVVAAINKGHRKFRKVYIKKPGKPRGMVKDGPEYVKLADLNGDGCVDAAVSLEVGRACMIYYGDCKGGIRAIDRVPAPSWGFSGLAAIGRGPGHPAMLALGEEMKLFIAKRSARGWNLEKKPAGSLPRDFSFVDIDGDGALDLLFANSAGSTTGILFGPF